MDTRDNLVFDALTRELAAASAGRFAAVEFEAGPHCGTYLLALNVGGIRGNTQSREANKGRDHCVVSAGAARLLLFRHGADHIAVGVGVN
jgi:hypothetical protein